MIRKEEIVGYFNILTQLFGGTEESHENSQSVWAYFGRRIEYWTSRQRMGYHLTPTFGTGA